MRIPIIIFLVVIAIPGSAQETNGRELQFIQHLLNQEEYEDAIYYINTRLNQEYPMPVRDSLNYFEGWSHYALKELEQSAFSLLQVSRNSPFFFKSRFFAAYNYSHLGIIPVSDQILNNLDEEKNLKNLKYFELAGNFLLKRDLNQFDASFKTFETSETFLFSIEKNNFKKYSLEIENHKNKSMMIGGLMSAIIPGSGKIYAGKTGEGISTFIIVAASGVTTYENYHKLGFKNAKTILFGSLFAVLYIGNIYGTVFTVKLVNEEFNHEMDNKILFNMHVPLRNIFN